MPNMTPQDKATAMLADWQRQRLAGIPPQDRLLPANDDLERDIEIIRQVMDRRR